MNSLGNSVSVNLDFYVSASGSDRADGSKAHPWKSLEKAAQRAIPGTTVHVMGGVYNSDGEFKTTAGGTAEHRIRYVSDEKWAAKLRSTKGGNSAVWWNVGDYVDIEGFDISGSGALGIYNTGSFTRIAGNLVHDIPAAGCPASGGAGILDGNFAGSDDDIIGNTVHDVGDPRATCTRVHGIYHANLRGNIVGNVVYHNQGWGIHLWHAANNVTVVGNEVFDNSYGGIVIGADPGDFPGRLIGWDDNTIVRDNKVYRNGLLDGAQGYGIEEYGAVGRNNHFENNIVYANRPGDWNLKNKSLQQQLSRAR
jgi:parallel beta-helix repeat protein